VGKTYCACRNLSKQLCYVRLSKNRTDNNCHRREYLQSMHRVMRRRNGRFLLRSGLAMPFIFFIPNTGTDGTGVKTQVPIERAEMGK
jgi:hypothetical protein